MPSAKDLRDLDDNQLVDQVKNARKDVFGLRFQHATGSLENTAGMRAAKRELARAITVAHARGIDTDRIR